MRQSLGFRTPGKANLPGTLGKHCRDLVPTFRAGYFLKSTVPAFSSFILSTSQSVVNEVTDVDKDRGPKINANFFCTKFSTTLRVMDVRTENRGRPRQKVRFPAAPVVGRNFLTPGHSGVRVRNVRRKSGPKSLCLCCFFFPEKRLTLMMMISGCWGATLLRLLLLLLLLALLLLLLLLARRMQAMLRCQCAPLNGRCCPGQSAEMCRRTFVV